MVSIPWRPSNPSQARRLIITSGIAVLITLAYLGTAYFNFDIRSAFAPSIPWTNAAYNPEQTRMIIMQHFSWHDPGTHRLQDLSRDQHAKYSRFWGYVYHYADDQYVEAYRHPRLRYMNKMYALLDLVIQQQALGDRGAEWVFLTDADVLIRNPHIPLHALLPPSSSALVVGCEDWNGFNAGNVLYRVSLELVAFLSHVIAITDEMTRTYHAALAAGEAIAEGNPEGDEDGHGAGVELPPSDQRAQCLALNTEAYAGQFYPVPDEWINAYPWYDRNELQLNTHFVGGNKHTDDLSEYERAWREGMRRVTRMGREELQQEVEHWRGKAKAHWDEVRVGAPKCDWI